MRDAPPDAETWALDAPRNAPHRVVLLEFRDGSRSLSSMIPPARFFWVRFSTLPERGVHGLRLNHNRSTPMSRGSARWRCL